jgi:hypothetical protein
VEEIEKGERGTGFDRFLRGRIETAAKKLNMGWKGPSAVTILDGDLMDSVGVDDEMRDAQVVTMHTGVVQLDLKAD